MGPFWEYLILVPCSQNTYEGTGSEKEMIGTKIQLVLKGILWKKLNGVTLNVFIFSTMYTKITKG